MWDRLGGMFKGDPARKTAERFAPRVEQVNGLEQQMQSKSDDDLRSLTKELQSRAQGGTSLDELLPEAFAVWRAFSLLATCV